MSKRKKFKVFVDGERWKPSKNKCVVCTSGGIFLLIRANHDYYGSQSTQKLSDVLPYYDIKWGDDNE